VTDTPPAASAVSMSYGILRTEKDNLGNLGERMNIEVIHITDMLIRLHITL